MEGGCPVSPHHPGLPPRLLLPAAGAWWAGDPEQAALGTFTPHPGPARAGALAQALLFLPTPPDSIFV